MSSRDIFFVAFQLFRARLIVLVFAVKGFPGVMLSAVSDDLRLKVFSVCLTRVDG